MNVFRPTYQIAIPADAKITTKGGKRYARFRMQKSDRVVTGEIMPNGKARILCHLYYCRIRKNGEYVRVALGVETKEAALQLAAQQQLKADHQRAGIIDRMAEHRVLTLLEHIDDYHSHLDATCTDKKHVAEVFRLIVRTCGECHFYELEDLLPVPLNKHLTKIIKKGNSYRTRNKCLEHMKAFVHWMMDAERLDTNPFRSIKTLNEDADPNKRERRALTAEELSAIIAAAEVGKVVSCISGEERAILYQVAVTTGLRAAELSKLTVDAVILDCETPHIVLPPALAKARREAIMPLHPVVIDRLTNWVEGRKPKQHLFHLLTATGNIRSTDWLIKHDCRMANVPYLGQLGFSDFHSLRTTFISRLCRLTDQFTAMKLARHTKATITAKHYDKQLLSQQAAVVAMMPMAKQT